MQQRECHHHPDRHRVRQQQQRDGVAHHAENHEFSLVEAVAEEPAAQPGHQARGRQQREDRRAGRHRIALALLQERPEVHVHGGDDKQRRGVTQGDAPEGSGVERLPGGKVGPLPRRVSSPRWAPGGHRDRPAARGQGAVGEIAGGLRGVAHEPRERQADQHDDDAGGERRRAPAMSTQRPGDDGREQAADRHAGGDQPERGGPPPREPVHDSDRDREVAAETAAERDQHEGEVERADRVHPAEDQEAQTEQRHADAHRRPRPEPVDQCALERAEQAALDLVHGVGAGEHRLAPAVVLLQHGDIAAVRAAQQQIRQRLEHHAGADDQPAVEDAEVPSPCPGRGDRDRVIACRRFHDRILPSTRTTLVRRAHS